MNRLYLKAGKIVRQINPALGAGIIACTRSESEDDITVGEAWEELAKVSPVWRRRLQKLVTGGAAGQLFWAHLPILLAVLMLEPVRSRLPMAGILSSVLDDDDQGDAEWGSVPGDESAESGPWPEQSLDIGAMMAMAQQMMGPVLAQRTAAAAPRDPGIVIDYPPGDAP
jgi:hypothetical protein